MMKLPDLSEGQRATPTPAGGVASYQPEDLGAAMAPGQAISELGNTIQGEVDRIGTLQAEDAYTKLRNWQLDQTVGPQGFQSLKGAAAVNGPQLPDITARFNDTAKEFGGNLFGVAATKFKARADIAGNQFKEDFLRHQVQQSALWSNEVTNTSIDAEIRSIAANYADDNAIGKSMVRINGLIDAHGQDPHVGLSAGAIGNLKIAALQKATAARLEAWSEVDPMAAYAHFKQNQSEIQDPEMRRITGHRLKEASFVVDTANTADRWVADALAQLPQQKAERNGFQTVVSGVMKREGGFNPSDGKAGQPVNHGINQGANPDIDVASLTPEKAQEIYKDRYWNKINGDSLPPALAVVAMDTAVNMGVPTAKEFLAKSGGDWKKFMALRQAKYDTLAADPELRRYQSTWAGRQSAVYTEAASADAPPAPDLSTIPNSRDVRAMLPLLLGKVDDEASKRFGTDTNNPDRVEWVNKMTAALVAKIGRQTTQLDAVQKQNQGDLIDFITGLRTGEKITNVSQVTGGAGSTGGLMPVNSVDQIYADPVMRAKWQMIDPQARVSLENLIHHNAIAGKGNDTLYWEAWNRIHAPEGDPKKIDFYQQMLDYAGPGKLNYQQISQLRQEIERNTTPGGRSANQMMSMGQHNAQSFFKSTPLFTAQPDRQIAATMRWSEDAGKKIDSYIEQNKPVRSLFMMDTPDSIVNPKYLQTYVDSTPSQFLSTQASAAKAGELLTPEKIAKLPQVPANMKTRDEANKWLLSLPPEVTYFRDENGIPRMVPGRPGQPPKGK